MRGGGWKNGEGDGGGKKKQMMWVMKLIIDDTGIDENTDMTHIDKWVMMEV